MCFRRFSFFFNPHSLINDYFLGKLGHFSLDFSTLPTNLEADCALCFPSHLFICLSAWCLKNGLAEAGGQTVLGPTISGLDSCDDADLGFPPLGTIKRFFLALTRSSGNNGGRKLQHSRRPSQDSYATFWRKQSHMTNKLFAACCSKSGFFALLNRFWGRCEQEGQRARVCSRHRPHPGSLCCGSTARAGLWWAARCSAVLRAARRSWPSQQWIVGWSLLTDPPEQLAGLETPTPWWRNASSVSYYGCLNINL